MSRSFALDLYGGWGLGNVGDDLLLASYIIFFKQSGVDVNVISRDRQSTAELFDTLGGKGRVVGSRLPTRGGVALFGGGGYLNGAWTGRGRLVSMNAVVASRMANSSVAHAVEFRNFSSHSATASVLGRALLSGFGSISVRDRTSASEVSGFGGSAGVVPDAATMIPPDVLVPAKPVRSDRILLNLLPVETRPDRDEAEFAVAKWRDDMASFIGSDRRITLLALGDADLCYARQFVDSSRIEVVSDLPSLLHSVASARAVVATRMHVLLAAAYLGRPSAGFAYNGKVRVALEAIGVDRLLATPGALSVEQLSDDVAHVVDSREWVAAGNRCREALVSQISGLVSL